MALVFAGHVRRLHREQRDRAWHAWNTALLPHFKSIPPLERFVARSAPRPPRPSRPRQTSEQQWAAFGAIAAATSLVNGT